MVSGDNYRTRLKALQDAQRANTASLLAPGYAAAILCTNEAWQQLGRLNRAMERRAAHDAAFIRERDALAEERGRRRAAEDARHEAVLGDERSTDAQRTHARTMLALNRTIAGTDVSALNTGILQAQMEMRVALAQALAQELDQRILAPDDSRFSLDAVIDGIDVAVGMIPVVGNIYASLRALYNISTRRRRTRDVAHQYARYLEDYVAASRLWIAAAEAAIRAAEFDEIY